MIKAVGLYNNFQIPACSKKAELKKDKRAQIGSLSSFDNFSSLAFLGNKQTSRVEVLNLIQNEEPFSEAGYKGTVYKLENKNGLFAVKIARTPEFSFSKEAEVLKKVPNGLGESQRFVDYFKDPKTGRDILVSTFAKGKKGVLTTDDDFKRFFENLLLLDREGIYHGDLNMENCLFNNGDINLIDFGEGSFFNLGDSYDEMYPDFMLKSNACNLEQNGIPDCIKKWDDMGLNLKETFKKYLRAKGEFYSKHSTLLGENAPREALLFEQNLARVLSNPSDDVIQNELRRIDLLYTFEHSDTAVNYKRIPEMGIRNWNLTIEKANTMLDKINETLKKPLSEDERTYFEFQKQTANKLHETYKNWGNSTIEWIKDSMKKDYSELSPHEKDFRENAGKAMELPPDLYGMVVNQ